MNTITEKIDLSTPMGIHHPLVGSVEKMPLVALTVVPVEFQVRNPKSNVYADQVVQEQEATVAVAQLVEIVKSGKLLDPVVVWNDPDSHEWKVVDGHHRMQAYTEADLSPQSEVWVQRLNVSTAGEARRFALQRNSRINLSMTQAECANEAWLAVLTGEAKGSIREIGLDYQVSKSVIGRMMQKAEEVKRQLDEKATSSGHSCDVLFIREHAPNWKKVAMWMESEESGKVDVDELDQRKVEILVKSLVVRYHKEAKANPELLVRAFQQFMEESTGWRVAIQSNPRRGDEEFDEDF